MPETVNGLRELRESRGWGKGRLAPEVGVSRQTINALAPGRCDPSRPLALRLALTFGRPVEHIFTLTT